MTETVRSSTVGSFKKKRKSSSVTVLLTPETTAFLREVEKEENTTLASAVAGLISRGHAKWKLERASASAKSSQPSAN